jgi:hypothetical protein
MERSTPFRVAQPASKPHFSDPKQRKTASVGVVLVALGIISAVVMTEMFTLLDSDTSSSSFLSSLLRSDDRSGQDASKLSVNSFTDGPLQDKRRSDGNQPKVTITISL